MDTSLIGVVEYWRQKVYIAGFGLWNAEGKSEIRNPQSEM